MTLPTDDPVKSMLLKKASQHRDEFKGELKEITESTEKIITNAVIIGGALALSYLIVRGFSGRKSKRKAKKAKALPTPEVEEVEYESKPSLAQTLLSDIGTTLANEATVLLVELAKEKLAAFLETLSQKKENENS